MSVAVPASLIIGLLERRAARRGAYPEAECWLDLAQLGEKRPSARQLATRWRCGRMRVKRLIDEFESALSPSVVEPAREMEPPESPQAPAAPAPSYVPQAVPQPDDSRWFAEDDVDDGPAQIDASTDSIEALLNGITDRRAPDPDPATAALEDEFEGLLGR